MSRSSRGSIPSFVATWGFAAVLLAVAWPNAGALAEDAAVLRDGNASEANPQARAAVQQYMTGPSVFIENAGQWADSSIKFALDGQGANVGITGKGPRFQIFRREAANVRPGRFDPSDLPPNPNSEPPAPSEMREFGVVFKGAAAVTPVGRGRSERKFNYLVGDAMNHREGVGSFDAVWYGDLYPGIDLELTGRRSGIKYNFHVAPGANWRAICIRYEGVAGLSLAEDGSLQIRVADGWEPISDGAPYIYQEIDGEKRAVVGRFALLDHRTCGFEITGAYDAMWPLVIDPEIAWGTYLGGASYESGEGIAVDSDGNAYVTGYTDSPGWVSGGWDTTLTGPRDGYVVKFDASGAALWSTYLGGISYDSGYGIAVDSDGNCYATGFTRSSGWISGGWDTTYGGNSYSDGYVVKLDASGAHLWSSYLGGAGIDGGYGIAVDSSGNCYATGYSVSGGWVSGGWDTSVNGGNDGYIVKLSPAGAHLWSSYFGGSGDDTGRSAAVDASGNVYISGHTQSTGWVSGGWDTTYAGNTDAFALKASSAGAHLWSTYIGGASNEINYGSMVVDTNGDAYATGLTSSPGWVSGGWKTTHGGGNDGYVVKLSSAGAHVWSTYLGSTANDVGSGIAVDASGNTYATGYTDSPGWVSGGWSTTLAGGIDAYVVKLSSAGAHVWSSYLGGALSDYGRKIATNSAGTMAWIAGETNSNDGWLVDGWQTTFGGLTDGFAAKIIEMPGPQAPSNPGATAIGTDTITWTWTDNSSDETGFKVYDDPGAGPPATRQTTTAADATSWQHGGLSANTQYAFQVAATNANDDSARTTNFTAWTLALVPGTPTVNNAYVHSLDVTLGADANPANTVYAIQVSPAVGGNTWVQADGTVGAAAVYQAAAAWGTKTVTGLSALTTYSFTVRARNGAGVTTGFGPAGVGTTLAALAVALQPVGGLKYVGDSHTFTVAASGGRAPLGYQWQKNGTNIAGATLISYALGSLATSDDADYRCVISDSDSPAQQVTSNGAYLHVRPVLTIVTHPVGANRAAGGSHTFTVTATGGYTPLAYQWRKNGTNIATGTLASYTLNPLAAGDQANYDCVATDNILTPVTSNSAFLSVLAIATQPASQSVTAGDSVTFSVTVLPGSGNSPYTYQWQKNGSDIANATTAGYSIALVQTSDAGNYAVIVGQTAGTSLTSSTAVLTVSPNPIVIATEPTGGSFYVGGTHTLTVAASGGVGTLNYQWRKNGTNIANATLSSLAFASLATSDDADYLCRVTDDSLPTAQTIDSAAAHVYVRAAVSVATQPVAANKAEGNSYTFTVVGAGGYAPLGYQWQKNGTNISDATDNQLVLDPLAAGDQAQYRCAIADTLTSSATSNAVWLRVLAIQTQPVSQSVTTGDPVTFSVTVLPGSGNSPYAYQWRKNGTNIGSATLSSYTIGSAQSTDVADYSCLVGQTGSGADTLLSSSAHLNVPANPIVIGTDPAGGSKYVGDSHTFTVSASGGVTPLTYQWTKGGTFPGDNISGATSTTYSLGPLALGDDADYYCVVTDSNALPQTLASALAHLYVRDPLSIATPPQSQAAYTGSPLTLTVSASDGFTPYTYQWRKNGTNIASATLISLSFASLATSDTGTYACRVRDALTGNVWSSNAVLQVADHIAIATDPQPLSVTEGQPATFTVTTTGGIGPISYQWRKDGGDITGATLDTYAIPNTVLLDAADYSCAATDENNNETVVSNEAALTVTPGLPAAGALGLTTLAAACAAWAIRRAKRRPVQT